MTPVFLTIQCAEPVAVDRLRTMRGELFRETGLLLPTPIWKAGDPLYTIYRDWEVVIEERLEGELTEVVRRHPEHFRLPADATMLLLLARDVAERVSEDERAWVTRFSEARRNLLFGPGLLLPGLERYPSRDLQEGLFAVLYGGIFLTCSPANDGFGLVSQLAELVEGNPAVFAAWPEHPEVDRLEQLAPAGPSLERVLAIAAAFAACGVVQESESDTILRLLQLYPQDSRVAHRALTVLHNQAVYGRREGRPGSWHRAARLAQRFLPHELARTHRTSFLRSAALEDLERGRLEAALRLWRQVGADSPHERHCMGHALLRQGLGEEAAHSWRRSLELQPNDALGKRLHELEYLLGWRPHRSPPTGKRWEAKESEVFELEAAGERAAALAAARDLDEPRLYQRLAGLPLTHPPGPPEVEARLANPEGRYLWWGGPHEITLLNVTPMLWREPGQEAEFWLPRVDWIVRSLAEFHRREFPSLPVRCAPVQDLGEGPALEQYESARRSYDDAAGLRRRLGQRRRPGHVVLLICVAPSNPCSGKGLEGLAMLAIGPESRHAETLAAHEFYHAAMNLSHSDGFSSTLDYWSLMNQADLPLSVTWLAPGQKAACVTLPGVTARVREGRLEERRGRVREALRHYLAALEIDPLHPWLNRRAVQLLTESRRWRALEPLLERWRALTGEWRASEALARLYGQTGRKRQARQLLLALPHRDWHANRESLSKALLHLDVRAAAKEISHELWRRVEFEMVSDLGTAYVNLGRYRWAERLYRLCLRRAPDSGPLLWRLALCQAQQGDLAGARATLGEVAPGPERTRVAAYLACLEGKWKKALQLSRGLKLEWWFGRGLLTGYCHWRLGDLAGAREAFRGGLEERCRDSRAWWLWLENPLHPELPRARRRLKRNPSLFMVHWWALQNPTGTHARRLRGWLPHLL